MKIAVQSNLVHVTPPCCYHVFDSYLEGLETREQERLDEQAVEQVEVEEQGQPWLPGLAYKRSVHGNTYWRTLERRQLPRNHPDYAGGTTCELDWTKAHEIIARAWLGALTERISDRCYDSAGNKAFHMRITYAGKWSPKEYNFAHDACDFYLLVSKPVLNRIFRSCLKDNREDFILFLRRQYSSYDGFISFMSNSIRDYDAYWKAWKSGAGQEKTTSHLIWASFNFWLLALPGEGSFEERYRQGQSEFEELLWNYVEDAEGNGKFSQAMRFMPEGEADTA
jgi:hypothetical protein